MPVLYRGRRCLKVKHSGNRTEEKSANGPVEIVTSLKYFIYEDNAFKVEI